MVLGAAPMTRSRTVCVAVMSMVTRSAWSRVRFWVGGWRCGRCVGLSDCHGKREEGAGGGGQERGEGLGWMGSGIDRMSFGYVPVSVLSGSCQPDQRAKVNGVGVQVTIRQNVQLSE